MWLYTFPCVCVCMLLPFSLLGRGLCLSYDLEEHANNVLSELVGALGGFIQSCFSHSTAVQSSVHSPPASEDEGSFYVLRNTVVPVLPLPPSITSKPLM